jgi:hypothetical protein
MLMHVMTILLFGTLTPSIIARTTLSAYAFRRVPFER